MTPTPADKAASAGPPLIEVVGLGPGDPGLVTQAAAERLTGELPLYLRTGRHPTATGLSRATTFDHHYEAASSFDEVYAAIVEDLVAAARQHGRIAYAVPGSPSVAERTVELLRAHDLVRSGEVGLVVHPAVSFLDLAYERLGVDPVAAGVRTVDGASFAVEAAGSTGPLVVAQCWDLSVLTAVKLSPEVPPSAPVTVLFHLGLPDERLWEVPWDDLDRAVVPDHLTSLWIPELDAPVARELVQLDDLVRTLRERCPWDRAQTHGSLRRHLLEECYEVLEVLDAMAALEPEPASPELDEALEEELGDLLFQVYLHARLAAEEGRFTLADVARGVHDKLVGRHPHVFGGDEAPTADDVAASWEVRKLAEKQRTRVTEGIPASLPALALAAKLQRKASAVGMVLPGVAEEAERAARLVGQLAVVASIGQAAGEAHGEAVGQAEGEAVGEAPPADVAFGEPSVEQTVGEVLAAVVSVSRLLGIDPEAALRSRLTSLRDEVDAAAR